jgi:hypothetical protein
MEEIFDSEGNLTEEGAGAEPAVEEGAEAQGTEEGVGAEPTESEGTQQEEGTTEEGAGAEPVKAEKKEHKTKSFQQRINQKTAEARRLAVENAYLKGQLDYAQKVETQKPEAQPPPEPEYPDIGNFEKEADFYAAVKKYQADSRKYNQYLIDKGIRDGLSAQGVTHQQQNQEAELKNKMNKTVQAGQAAHDDFNVVVGAAYREFTPTIGDFIMDSPQGGEIMYQLAGNSQALQRIKSLPPNRAIAELVRIEDFLLKKKPAVSFTPVTRIKGGGNAQKGKLTDIEDMKKLEKERYG